MDKPIKVDPLYFDIMKSAILWISANKQREKAFKNAADLSDEQWQELVETVYDETEAE